MKGWLSSPRLWAIGGEAIICPDGSTRTGRSMVWIKESGGTYSDVSLLGGDPNVAPALSGIDVIKSISLNDTVDFGTPMGIDPASPFFFCDPPFVGGRGCGANGANTGATFDSFIMACTIGF